METLAHYEQLKSAAGGKGDRAVMAAMTEDLDTCVGALMKHLDELGIAQNTVVIYMSDNGGRTEILSGGKGNLGDGGLRVPLIVRGPGIHGGVYCNEPVIGYDIFATILDFVAPGFVLPKGIEGGSWKTPLINDGKGKVQRPINRLVFHQSVEIDHPQSAIRKKAYAALRPGGVLAVWSAGPDAAFTRRLRHAGFQASIEQARAHGKRGARFIIWLGIKPKRASS